MTLMLLPMDIVILSDCVKLHTRLEIAVDVEARAKAKNDFIKINFEIQFNQRKY